MTKIRELRKKQILEASLGLVEDGGLRNITTKNVAEKVGISESSLYNIFKSKDEIMLEALKFLHDRRMEMVAPMFEKDFNSIDEVVDSITTILIEVSDDKYCYADLAISSDRALMRDEDARDFLEKSCENDLMMVQTTLEKMETCGLISLKDSPNASYALLILLMGHIFYNLMFQDRNKNNDKLKETIKAMFDNMARK